MASGQSLFFSVACAFVVGVLFGALAVRSKRRAEEEAVIEAARDMFRGAVLGDFSALRKAVRDLDGR